MTRAPWQRKSVAEGTPHNPVSAATDFSRSGHSACEGGVKPARGFVIPVRGTRSGDCANNIINDILDDVRKADPLVGFFGGGNDWTCTSSATVRCAHL